VVVAAKRGRTLSRFSGLGQVDDVADPSQGKGLQFAKGFLFVQGTGILAREKKVGQNPVAVGERNGRGKSAPWG